MLKGVLYALAACCIWGLIFVVPYYVEGFNAIEVALGRYVVYGLLSTCIFFVNKLQGAASYPRAVWRQALGFSLISTIVYYTAVILSVRYATPAVCALILGVAPVTIAFYGNWRQREYSFGSLVPSSMLILLGLALINLPHLAVDGLAGDFSIGLACSLIALAAWSWYVVANARFLKDNPAVSSNDWPTLIGVATLFWVGVVALLVAAIDGGRTDMGKYLDFDATFVRFMGGSAVLGIACSWVGAYLWNQASRRLPIALAGQLSIFETVFGLLFVYGLARQMPSLLEGAGIVVLLGAVVYGLRSASQHAAQPAGA